MINQKIHLEKGQKIWFSSDFHYSHNNICRGTTRWKLPEHGGDDAVRDFVTLEEMNQTIVDGINNKIKEDDILVFLGDWSFGGIENVHKFRNLIKCKNIYFVLGNHDKHIDKNTLYEGVYTRDLFSYVCTYMELTVTSDRLPTTKLCLSHFPMVEWHKPHKNLHLFGHVHGNYFGKGKSMDVGIDNIFKITGEYHPLELEEIITYLNQ